MKILSTFSARLSALFLVLILAVGIAIAWYSIQSFMMFTEEAEQKLNHGLATDLAVEFQPLLHHSMDRDSLEERIHYVMGLNPKIEIYLLGSNGMIKASFTENEEGPIRTVIDTTILNEFLAGAPIPILGPDPLSNEASKPFSTAHVTIMGEEGCYVYVILGSHGFDSAAAMIRDSYIIQGALRMFVLIISCVAVIGLFLFSLMTRRLTAMTNVVTAFERGDIEQRVRDKKRDELGQLGASFDQMADTVVESIEDLRRTDKLRRELIANVSHDLRSPLATIQGYLETITIKHDDLSDEEREQYMSIVLKNTRSLNQLVGQLFELSKLDAQQVEPKPEPLSVSDLAQDLVMHFKPAAEKANVNLEIDVPDRVGLIEADIALVERAISNLIDNAIRHTPSAGVVRMVVEDETSAVVVKVVDNGTGIPPEDLPHIFERFYRVEKSRSKDSGRGGLGLAIAKKIIELHGATLDVTSILNQGTTFSFSLPK
jgi:two-component system OmpR family sensor kinase